MGGWVWVWVGVGVGGWGNRIERIGFVCKCFFCSNIFANLIEKDGKMSQNCP